MDPFRLLVPPTPLRRVFYLFWRLDEPRFGLRAFSKKSISALDAENDGTKKPRPKTVPIPKITLISPDNSMTVTVLEDAQRLANRRNLVLTKVTNLDTKTQRAVYKLISSSDYIGGESEETVEAAQRDGKDKRRYKDTKLLYISARITEYDLKIKMKNVVKLLNKGHKVKLVLTLDDSHESNTKSIIDDTAKAHGSIQHMPSKKNMMVYLITPLSGDDDAATDSKQGTDVNKSQSNNA